MSDMKKRSESFSKRLTRRVMLTVVVIMTSISVFVFLVSATGMLVYSRTHYSDIMDKARSNMSLIMSKVEVSSDNIIDELVWHLSSPEDITKTLAYEYETNHHLYGCGIGFISDYYPKQGHWYELYAFDDRDGITVRSIGSESHDYFNAEWYTKGLESAMGVWSNPYIDDAGAGTMLCTFSRLVKEPEGRIAGVFGTDVSIEGLSSVISDYIKKENEEDPFYKVSPEDKDLLIYCFIIGPDGSYIVHPDKDRILKANYYDYAAGKGAAKYKEIGDAMRAGETGEKITYVDGIRSSIYYAPLLDSGWSMGIVVPTKRLFGPGFLFGSGIIFLILLGLLIVYLLNHRAIKKSSKPLIQLADSAKKVAAGKFDTELPEIETNDELRLLRDSFDNMQKSLAEYVEELTETTAQKASLERELDVARKIQMSMVPMTWPAFPDRADIDMFGCVTPAKAVGGDLYDFRIREGKLFFCIGDVSGKGIPAALVMTVVSSMFRMLSDTEENPAKIVSSINYSLSARNESLMFITLFVGALDLSTGELQYVNAGHNAPILIFGGKPRMLQVDSNLPVGIMQDWEFSLQKTTLAPGTVLFLYTDGLTEATRSGGQLFGEARVLETLAGQDEKNSAEDIITHMTDAVSDFVGDSEQSDDLTMLVMKILHSTLSPSA